MHLIYCLQGNDAALQRQRTGWEAVDLDSDASEERAVAPELAEEAQLHAAQQLHAQRRRRQPAQEQLSSTHNAEGAVLNPEWYQPEPECRHLTWGLPPAGWPAPPCGEEDGGCWCVSCSYWTSSFSVPCLIQIYLPTLSLLMLPRVDISVCVHSHQKPVHRHFLCTDGAPQTKKKTALPLVSPLTN